MPRKNPKEAREAHVTRTKPVKLPGPFSGPFEEVMRREGAAAIGSSRIGEIRRMENVPKMGRGDLQRSEDRRLRGAAYREEFQKKRAKSGFPGTGKKIST